MTQHNLVTIKSTVLIPWPILYARFVLVYKSWALKCVTRLTRGFGQLISLSEVALIGLWFILSFMKVRSQIISYGWKDGFNGSNSSNSDAMMTKLKMYCHVTTITHNCSKFHVIPFVVCYIFKLWLSLLLI